VLYAGKGTANCLNHRVVTLVADELERQLIVGIWKSRKWKWKWKWKTEMETLAR